MNSTINDDNGSNADNDNMNIDIDNDNTTVCSHISSIRLSDYDHART